VVQHILDTTRPLLQWQLQSLHASHTSTLATVDGNCPEGEERRMRRVVLQVHFGYTLPLLAPLPFTLILLVSCSSVPSWPSVPLPSSILMLIVWSACFSLFVPPAPALPLYTFPACSLCLSVFVTFLLWMSLYLISDPLALLLSQSVHTQCTVSRRRDVVPDSPAHLLSPRISTR
jgi:hypothetical protein